MLGRRAEAIWNLGREHAAADPAMLISRAHTSRAVSITSLSFARWSLDRDVVAVDRCSRSRIGDNASCSKRRTLSLRDAGLSVPCPERAELRRDETEYDRLVLRHEAQRAEVAGAVVVVFEEVGVEVHLRQHASATGS